MTETPRAKPLVVVLATGGTIAGAGETAVDAGYSSGALPVDRLLAAVPPLGTIARVRGEQIAQIGSQDMTDALWLALGKRVDEHLGSPDVHGVVVTHGTDTLEETAYFLNLVVDSEKPVVLTGAMRPATGLSADGPLNLFNAVKVAAEREAVDRGVMVVINDEIHAAREVTKSHTTLVQTFESPNRGPLGAILPGAMRFSRWPTHRHTHRSVFRLGDAGSLPRVDVLYAHADMPPDVVDAHLALGARGLVVAGVGNGNMTRGAVTALARAAGRGVVVVRSTRTGAGVVLRNIEIDDDALGFVAADGLSPHKARILLKLALARTNDVGAIQELFFKY